MVKNLTLSSPAVVDVRKRIVASIYTPPKDSLALALGATSSPASSSQYSLDRPCEGDITHYDTSLRAYGITSDRDA